MLEDEAASFLRGLDAGDRYGGNLHIALNLDYAIQLGSACELVIGHGWIGADVQVEVGEFDAR